MKRGHQCFCYNIKKKEKKLEEEEETLFPNMESKLSVRKNKTKAARTRTRTNKQNLVWNPTGPREGR